MRAQRWHGARRRGGWVVVALVGAALARPARAAQPALDEAAPTAAPAGAEPAPAPEPRAVGDAQRGVAVWYGAAAHGKRTSSGERFDRRKLTAAHRTLPFGARVRVRNLRTGASVIVRINDRGPFGKRRERIIDVSEAAARVLGMIKAGSCEVELEVRSLPPRRAVGARRDLRARQHRS